MLRYRRGDQSSRSDRKIHEVMMTRTNLISDPTRKPGDRHSSARRRPSTGRKTTFQGSLV